MQEAGLGMGMGMMSGEVSAAGDHHRQVKAEIANHPLYEQLLSAHVSCLRVATPIDQLPLIDGQLSQSHHLLRSYASHHSHSLSPHDRQELDNFMAQYLIVLCTFKEQLQQHVRVHAVEAVMACRDIESTLQALTGVSLGEGTGATMSDDEDDLQMDGSLDQSSADGHDMMGFGPLLPTESERSLMERVRQELKIELKQGFKSRIEDVREEILRKRRAGKLPGDTTSVLKAWWQQHAKWPYPTEDDKAKLVEETGLQLKQINNWFINQRKRNWHSNSQSVNSLKSKRKSLVQKITGDALQHKMAYNSDGCKFLEYITDTNYSCCARSPPFLSSENFSQVTVKIDLKDRNADYFYQVEDLLKNYDNVCTLRVRMPISSDLLNPRNFITKITRYEKVVDIPNSMTILDELLPISIEMGKRNLTGIWNFTNPGVVSHNEILEMYRDYVDPNFTWNNFTLEEQAKVIVAPRSNNELDAAKLKKEFPELLSIKDSLIKYVFEPNQKVKAQV
ncbi:hypothetical protein JHK82_047398 [Glycine max]|nr:hypothetical protein JHK82_047398 [Glycine max]